MSSGHVVSRLSRRHHVEGVVILRRLAVPLPLVGAVVASVQLASPVWSTLVLAGGFALALAVGWVARSEPVRDLSPMCSWAEVDLALSRELRRARWRPEVWRRRTLSRLRAHTIKQ